MSIMWLDTLTISGGWDLKWDSGTREKDCANNLQLY